METKASEHRRRPGARERGGVSIAGALAPGDRGGVSIADAPGRRGAERPQSEPWERSGATLQRAVGEERNEPGVDR